MFPSLCWGSLPLHTLPVQHQNFNPRLSQCCVDHRQTSTVSGKYTHVPLYISSVTVSLTSKPYQCIGLRHFFILFQQHTINSMSSFKGGSWWPRPRLLERGEAPEHRAHNPFILDGYLPPLSLWGCLHSLLYVHNETGNILTHALPLLFIVACGPSWGSLQGLDAPLVAWLMLIVLALPWAASTLYHTFMAHRGGHPVYRALLRLDIVIICLSVSLGPLPHMFVASLALATPAARAALLLLYCHTCLYSLSRALQANTSWECRTCYGPPILVVAGCWLLRMSPWGGDHTAGAKFIPPMVGLFVLGGVLGAMYVPERWAPGRLDLAGNSHQIMHVLVVAAQYYMFRGALADLHWLLHDTL